MKHKKIRWNTKCVLCLVPSLLGLAVFFVIPYFRVLYYSLINNQFRRQFVGLKNYIETIQNEYFRLAFQNSILLIVICVPLLLLLALLVSLGLAFLIRKLSAVRVAFILPMLLPTASVVFFSVLSLVPLTMLCHCICCLFGKMSASALSF